MTVDETWLPVAGYEGLYAVSSLGRVISLRRLNSRGYRQPERILKIAVSGGYGLVTLTREARQVKFRVHQLVAIAFHGPPGPGHEVRHLDGCGLNNTAVNLRWGTPSENAYDRTLHGTNPMLTRNRCPLGHEYTPQNTIRERGGTARRCRTCKNIARRRRRASHRAPQREHRGSLAADLESLGHAEAAALARESAEAPGARL